MIYYFNPNNTTQAQVDTGTLDSYDAATTYTITIGGESVSTVGTGGSTTTTATALRAAFNASTHPYFAGITCSGTGANIILTSDTAGVPFSASLTASGGTGAVTDFSNTTANLSPNAWQASNFTDSNGSTGLPGAGDTVIFANSIVDLLWNIDQSSVSALAKILVSPSYTGKIGLNYNVFQSTSTSQVPNYPEYRPVKLAIKADEWILGGPVSEGNGSTRKNIDILDNPGTVVNVYGSATSSADTPLPAVRIKGDDNTSDIYVYRAPSGVGINVDIPTDVSEFRNIIITQPSGGQPTDTRAIINGNTTIDTITVYGGVTIADSLADDITVWGGVISLNGTQTITNLVTYNGTINCNASGTITKVDGRGGLVNFNDNYTPRTVTDVDIYRDCTLRVGDHITVTNGITNKGLIQLAGSVST